MLSYSFSLFYYKIEKQKTKGRYIHGPSLQFLTHWGRATHICVGKLTIIGSNNGVSTRRRQTIIWTNAGIMLIRHLGTNFSEILIGNETFSFKKMHLKCRLLNGVHFAVFPTTNWTNKQTNKTCFCFNHASSFYMSNNIVKMLTNTNFKAQTLTGNHTGNYRCQLLASRAFNMSRSFSQSVRSIESWCVAKTCVLQNVVGYRLIYWIMV